MVLRGYWCKHTGRSWLSGSTMEEWWRTIRRAVRSASASAGRIATGAQFRWLLQHRWIIVLQHLQQQTRTSGGDGDYSPPRDELPQCVTRSSSEPEHIGSLEYPCDHTLVSPRSLFLEVMSTLLMERPLVVEAVASVTFVYVVLPHP